MKVIQIATDRYKTTRERFIAENLSFEQAEKMVKRLDFTNDQKLYYWYTYVGDDYVLFRENQ